MRQAVLIFFLSFAAIAEPLNDTILYQLIFQLDFFFLYDRHTYAIQISGEPKRSRTWSHPNFFKCQMLRRETLIICHTFKIVALSQIPLLKWKVKTQLDDADENMPPSMQFPSGPTKHLAGIRTTAECGYASENTVVLNDRACFHYTDLNSSLDYLVEAHV